MRALIATAAVTCTLLVACEDSHTPTLTEPGRDSATLSAGPLSNAGDVLVSETSTGTLRLIAADGSGRTLLRSYQHSDEATMVSVVLEAPKLRKVNGAVILSPKVSPSAPPDGMNGGAHPPLL